MRSDLRYKSKKSPYFLRESGFWSNSLLALLVVTYWIKPFYRKDFRICLSFLAVGVFGGFWRADIAAVTTGAVSFGFYKQNGPEILKRGA